LSARPEWGEWPKLFRRRKNAGLALGHMLHIERRAQSLYGDLLIHWQLWSVTGDKCLYLKCLESVPYFLHPRAGMNCPIKVAPMLVSASVNVPSCPDVSVSVRKAEKVNAAVRDLSHGNTLANRPDFRHLTTM
jgi:hypothetical protein